MRCQLRLSTNRCFPTSVVDLDHAGTPPAASQLIHQSRAVRRSSGLTLCPPPKERTTSGTS